MHNRDIYWKTADGRLLKIKDINEPNLCNIIKFINENLEHYINVYGSILVDSYKYNIEQEIRLRKLNRLKEETNELF